MAAPLTDEIRQYLRALENTQGELAELFARKRVALVTPRSEELQQLGQIEAELVGRLHGLAGVRGRLLQQAAQAGLPSDSLDGLAGRLPEIAAREFRPQIERARQQAARLRTESWTHWIIAQRAAHHYTQVLDLIAHCGRTSPTYGRTPDRSNTGGAILDATA